MLQDAFDFESVIEAAIAAVLTSAGLTVFTTGQVPDFQKDRPRVQVQYTHGVGHQQWANPNKLPDDLKGQKIETAWASTLHTTLVTSADENGKADQAEMRSLIRLVYINLANQLNGVLLTGHRFNIVKETGSARSIHPNDSNTEILQLTHEIQVSLHESVWTSYERITDFGTVRSGFTRTVTGEPTTTLFKNIPDLNDSGTVISGSGVLELYQNGENVKVTVDTLSSAIGGGGGGAQISSGLADPVLPPTDPTKVALRFNENTGYGWRWVVKDQAWT